MGQCTECGEWNTFEESLVAQNNPRGSKMNSGGVVKPFYLSQVKASQLNRYKIGILEFDRVLGGGFVPGQVILLAGEPGIGKSTLLTQLAKTLQQDKSEVIYVCGEESPSQVKIRAERMDYSADNLLVMTETNTDTIVESVRGACLGNKSVKLIIVDSIQTLSSSQLMGVSGSVGQVRLSAGMLSSLSKELGIPLIIVGHVTKEGTVAGPKVLEHMVDTVLYLEGDNQHMFRVLKTTKNRFGPVSEVGLFEMREGGLMEVLNPSELFLSNVGNSIPGSCVTVVMEGYRPLLFEVQALTSKTSFGYPRRTSSGYSNNRLQVLIAVLENRCGINLSNHDVYVNVVGGLKIDDYGADLAVCLAIVSAVKGLALSKSTAAFGEIGLLGEIRAVSNEGKRLSEAKKLGYTNALSSSSEKQLKVLISKQFKK